MILKEGVEGAVNIKQIYKELNQEFFNGALPNITVKWNGKLKKAVGRAYVEYKGTKVNRGKLGNLLTKTQAEIPVSNVEINMSSLKIDISKNVNLQLRDVKAVMLHEQVHILLYTKKKLGDHHDSPEFQNWIKKLRDASGYDVPMRESNFKASPTLQAKDGFVLLLWSRNGSVGAVTYSKNFMVKNWMMFAKVVGRIIGSSSKIRNAEMYRVSHPFVSEESPKRALKKISWRWIEEKTAQEIQQRGRRFFIADRTGGQIAPFEGGIPARGIKKDVALRFDKYGDWINATEALLISTRPWI